MFLPPANEVCEGHVFTRVSLSTGGGDVPAPGGPGGGACSWEVCLLLVGVPVLGGGLQAHTRGSPSPHLGAQAYTQEGFPGKHHIHPVTATATGGTHPTGMHCCHFLREIILDQYVPQMYSSSRLIGINRSQRLFRDCISKINKLGCKILFIPSEMK